MVVRLGSQVGKSSRYLLFGAAIQPSVRFKRSQRLFLLNPHWNSTPMDPDNWYGRHFVPTVMRAKLRQIGLHTLRHDYASLLINQGESIKYVSKQLGHASIQITADLYGHLFKETSVSAMNKLSMRIADARPSNVVAMATGTQK